MAEHVVPLEDLMQDDAINETAQPHPEEEAGQPRGPRPGGSGLCSWSRHGHALLLSETGLGAAGFHQATAFFCRALMAEVWPQFVQEIR
jgi:hypothetical protein